MTKLPWKDWKEAFHKENRPRLEIETRTLPPFEYELGPVRYIYMYVKVECSRCRPGCVPEGG